MNDEAVKLDLSSIGRKLGTGKSDLKTRLDRVRRKVTRIANDFFESTNLKTFVSRDDIKAISIASQSGATNIGGTIFVKHNDGTIEEKDFSIDDRSHKNYDTPFQYVKHHKEEEEGRLELNALFNLFAFVSKYAKVNIETFHSHAGVDVDTLLNEENKGRAKGRVEGHLGHSVDFQKQRHFIRDNRNVAGVNSYVKGIFPQRIPLHFAGMMAKVMPKDTKFTTVVTHANNYEEVFRPEADRNEFRFSIMNDSEGPINYAANELGDDLQYAGRNAMHIIGGTGCNVTFGFNLDKTDGGWKFAQGTQVTEAGHDPTIMFDNGWDYENYGQILEPFRHREGKPGLSSFEDIVAGCPKADIDRGVKGVLNYIKALNIARSQGVDAIPKSFNGMKSVITASTAQEKLDAVLDKLGVGEQDMLRYLQTHKDLHPVIDSYDIQKAAEEGDVFCTKLLENWLFRVGRMAARRYGGIQMDNLAYISFTGSHIVRCMNNESIPSLKEKFIEGLKAGGLVNFGDNGEKLVFIDTNEANNKDDKWDNMYYMARKYIEAA